MIRFVGAGPGAADLITVRGQRVIETSPVCLYAGSLVPADLLARCPEGARIVDTANLNLDQILAEMTAAHERGLDVARLHSGDPSVFSAMAEQMRRLDAAGVPYEVVPGVPAFAAAAASLKRELTVPGWPRRSSSPALPNAPPPCRRARTRRPWGASKATMVLHLAVQRHRAGGRGARGGLRRGLPGGRGRLRLP